MTNEEQKLWQALTELQKKFESLRNNSTIPFEIRSAFIKATASNSASAKTAASETQAVAEGGSSNYSVAKPMDGFVTIVVNGIPRQVPFYD